jgi:PPM family protein phosphatase
MFTLWKKSKQKRADQDRSGQKVEETVSEPEQFRGPEYKVVVSLQTDPGCQREINEDQIFLHRPDDPDVLKKKGILIVVADGMGGHSAGEVASGMAVEIIDRVYFDDAHDPASALKSALEEANFEIHKASLGQEGLRGMGTTCTALVLQNGSAIAAHVGDSRLYLVRGGQIYLMTEDHSEVMEMVKRGLISLEEARHHPDKNVILRAIGSHAEVQVSTWAEPFPTREGDRFLLCSDGLYDLVEDDEIKRAVEQAEPEAACESLVALAKERGGHDNISVAVVNLLPLSESQTKPVPETRELEAVI